MQQRRRRRKRFKSKPVTCKVDENTETVILFFFGCTGGILETQELFPKAYFTHQSIYAYLPLFMGSWNLQEYCDSDIFWPGGQNAKWLNPWRKNAKWRKLLTDSTATEPRCDYIYIYIYTYIYIRTYLNIASRTYFGSVAVESVRSFRHFAFWRHGFKPATFCIVHMACIF